MFVNLAKHILIFCNFDLCSHLRPGAVNCKLRLHSTGTRALIHDLKDSPNLIHAQSDLTKANGTMRAESGIFLTITKAVLNKILARP